MGTPHILSGMLYCADCGEKMYLCRCTTMKQAEYFNCSIYRKKKKKYCSRIREMLQQARLGSWIQNWQRQEIYRSFYTA